LISESEHIDDLIGKVLSKEASAEETAVVEAWRSENAENARYFMDMQSIFSRAESIPEQRFDTDAAWAKVSAQIGQKTRVVQMRPTQRAPRLRRMAAVIVALLGIGAAMFVLLNKRQPEFALRSSAEVLRDTLPDGSMAALNSRSSLTYEFDEKHNTRKAKLTGEAFFEVKHDDSRPFIIETESVFIKDIGTAFNVKALPGSDSIEVFVKEGEVAFFTEGDPGLLLVAGEKGLYLKSSRKFSRESIADENEAAYADKEFRFRNTPMKKVIRKLNEVYDIKIELSNAALEECTLARATFMNEDIETIASVIAESMQWTTGRKDGKIILYGESCE
jgi:transmembrane sensor